MINCMKCGGFISHDSSNLESICTSCAGELADNLSPADLVAMAKVGMDALIDEATGYQQNRPHNDLAKRHKKYEERP